MLLTGGVAQVELEEGGIVLLLLLRQVAPVQQVTAADQLSGVGAVLAERAVMANAAAAAADSAVAVLVLLVTEEQLVNLLEV